MQNTNFLEKVEQLTHSNLVFPYHIRFQDLTGKRYYNKMYPNDFHEHSFEAVLRVVFDEPNAFHLTEEDQKFYSEQELELISKLIIACT